MHSRKVIVDVHVGVARPVAVVKHVVEGVVGHHVALAHDPHQVLGVGSRRLWLLLVGVQMLRIDEKGGFDAAGLLEGVQDLGGALAGAVVEG